MKEEEGFVRVSLLPDYMLTNFRFCTEYVSNGMKYRSILKYLTENMDDSCYCLARTGIFMIFRSNWLK